MNWQVSLMDAQARMSQSDQFHSPRISGQKRRAEELSPPARDDLGEESIFSPTVINRFSMGLPSASNSDSGRKNLKGRFSKHFRSLRETFQPSASTTEKLQTVAEVEAISRTQTLTEKAKKLTSLYENNPKKGLKEFVSEFHDDGYFKLELLELIFKELGNPNKVKVFCKMLCEKFGEVRSLELFKKLISRETKDKEPENLFDDYQSPAFLVMEALLKKNLGNLEMHIRCISPYILIFCKPQTEVKIREVILKKLVTGTVDAPQIVKEINSYLKEIASGAYDKAGKEGAYKFAFIPFYHVFVVPLFIDVRASSEPAKRALIKLIDKLPNFLEQQPNKFNQIEEANLKKLIENITEPHSLELDQ